MKSPIGPLLFVLAFAPFVVVAQTVPAAPAKAPALQPWQLNDGLKSGLNAIVTQALVAGAIKVPTPRALEKTEPNLVKAKKESVLADFNKALADTTARVAAKSGDQIKNAVKDVKIEDATVLLSGAPDACTTFVRKTMGSDLRDAILVVVKQAASSTGLVAKARDVFNASNPRGAMGVDGGTHTLVEMNDYVCNQVLAQSFKLIAQKEAAVRANPSLLTGNALAQKVFEAYKK